jgi:hypothetical protein
MDDKMTFTVTAYGKSVTITQPEDLNIHEFLDTCRQLAMVMEYHQDSWDDAIIAAAEDISDVFTQEQVDKYENAVTIELGGNSGNMPLPHNPPQTLYVHGNGSVHTYPGIDGVPLKMSDC